MTYDIDTFCDDGEDTAIWDALSESRRRRASLMAAINARYCSTGRDREIEKEVHTLVEGAAVSHGGFETERRALFLIGETGAGKTRAVNRVIDRLEEFKPVETTTTTTCSIVRLVAPSPCTLKMLGVEILFALGYPLVRDLKESVAWGLVRRQLMARRVRFILIDEGQHMLNWTNMEEMKKLSDTLKNVMQQRKWSVRLIVVGLPELAEFLSLDAQLHRRSHVVHLGNVEFPKDAKLLKWIAETIVCEHSGMKFDFTVEDEFLARLCHASSQQFGIVTQIVRGAVEQVLLEDASEKEVTRKHFARSYAVFSGCAPVENILAVSNWREIVPQNALNRERELANDDADPRAKKGPQRNGQGGTR